MSNSSGKDNTAKRGRRDLELEDHPRLMTTNINTEAPTHFVLRGRPLERPVYTLRRPSAVRSNASSTFPMFDLEMEAQQKTASTPSPEQSRPGNRCPQTPVPARQTAPAMNPMAGQRTQDSLTTRPEINVVAAPRTTAAETRQHAGTSSSDAPSTPADNTSASSRPRLNAATANSFTAVPTPPATPVNSATLATPSSSNTRSPSRAWTTGEEAALAESVRYVVEHGGHQHPVLEMWEIIGRRVCTVHDVQKTGSACRLWYCRKLRAEIGFDERKVAKANMVTCSQKPGLGARRRRREDDEDVRGPGKAGLVRG